MPHMVKRLCVRVCVCIGARTPAGGVHLPLRAFSQVLKSVAVRREVRSREREGEKGGRGAGGEAWLRLVVWNHRGTLDGEV